MSSSIIQAIWPGEKHENIIEYRNSWGTAPIVWDFFCEKYLHRGPCWWRLHGSREEEEFWRLWYREDIPAHQRAVFLWTLDHIYVRFADYARFARDLRRFLLDVKISANRFNHWPEIAQFFEAAPQYPALSLWCTTVVSDPFAGPYNEEAQDRDPFDWSKAHDLYSELSSKD